jgi:predicted AAA+ superfamily ATPase
VAALERAMRVVPVVVLTGARQTGKSTLVREAPALAGRPYLTLDDIDVRDQAQAAPASLLARAPELVLDEVQRAPDLLLEIKLAVDRDRPRHPGRYVVTGSANLLLMERVSESLAGRAHYLTLWPLTRRERLGAGRTGLWSELMAAPAGLWPEVLARHAVPCEDWRSATALGGLPVPAHALSTDEERALWFDGYVQTYLERDLQILANIDSLGDFRRLMRAAALRVGSVVNQTELARDVALSRPTAHRWLNLLETSYQLVRVDAYAVNRTKRLIKSPKLYWGDVGLARYLAGGPATGAHLENLILADLVAWRDVTSPKPSVLFWRTENGEEVDFVVEAGRRLLAVEVKATERPSHADTRHLKTFAREYGDAVLGGLLLHAGDDVVWLDEGILAAPWWSVI